MAELVVNDAQAKIISSATEEILVRDAQGNVLARIPPVLSEDEDAIVKEAKRRLASDQPRYPTAEVLERLDSLDAQPMVDGFERRNRGSATNVRRIDQNNHALRARRRDTPSSG